MEQGKNETDSEVCKFCGAKLWAGASFCVNCGNTVDVETQESKWGVPAKNVKGTCSLTILQKIAWGLIVIIAIYGVYAMWGGKIIAPVVGSQSRQDAASADVSAAEARLRDLKRSIIEEDARKKNEAEAAQERFRRQVEEVKSLGEEFSGGAK